MKTKRFIIFGLIFFAATFTACKKTIGLDPLPANLITAYKVSSVDGDIYGAITESTKTITIYIPAYFKLGVIDPEIKVSEGATLKTEILPVKLTDSTTTYQVIGADQSTSTYKLKIVMQQEDPMYISYVYSQYNAPNTSLAIGGNFFATDAADIHVYLVDAQGKETAELGPTGFGYTYTRTGGLFYLSGINIPVDLAEGDHFVKVKVFGLTAKSETALSIKYRQPTLSIFETTAKVGSTITIASGLNTVFKNLTSLTGTINGVSYNFPIVSQSATTATVQLPTELKTAGSYFVTYTAVFTGWSNSTAAANLILTE